MVDILLVGNGDKSWTNSYPAGYKGYKKFSAAYSGVVKNLKGYISSYTSDPNLLRLALYADSSNSPGTLLAQAVGGSNCTYTWISLSVSDVTVSAGSAYWIGFQVGNSVDVLLSGISTGSASKYASSTWSDFVSSPSSLSDGAWDIGVAAWGTESASGASVGLIGSGLCGNSPLVGQILS